MYYKLIFVTIFISFQWIWAHPNGTSFLEVTQKKTTLSFHLNLNQRDVLDGIGFYGDQIETLKQVKAYTSQRLRISLDDEFFYLDWDTVSIDSTEKITYDLYAKLPLRDSTTVTISPLFFVELNIVPICHIVILRGDTTLLDRYFTDNEEARLELFHPTSFYLEEKTEKIASWVSFIWIGFKHIIPFGLDHILFVIGLFLFSRRWRILSTQTFVFTFAHSLSLALSLLGLFSLSSNIVEPLIALSIVFIVFENLFLKTKMLYRLIVVLFFGFLHGMGFASALRNLKVDSNSFLSSLMSFNIGLELGQILVLLIMFILTIFIHRRLYYQKFFIIPLNIIIGMMGLYWFIDRLI